VRLADIDCEGEPVSLAVKVLVGEGVRVPDGVPDELSDGDWDCDGDADTLGD